MMKSIFCCVTLLLVGCVAPKESQKHAQQPWEPEQFEYQLTALMGGQSVLHWDGACLVENTTHLAPLPGARPEKGKVVRYHPTQAQWETFWKEAERLKMPKWRKDYRPEDMGWSVDDGMRWSFCARVGSVVIETAGENAGPALPDYFKTRVIGSDGKTPTAALDAAVQKLKG